ncbi:glycosyltransferase [Prosthecobacter sp.]|uniref:glycosyltransferase n=1 Tax=Prosthecobacter sp. TaxID=1965333 RepID=UPI001D1DE724|nr:glycosyltransferase [Prosthecobacter sp.]MCB1276982.1 glycosyltransferase [Prosthecobacter sp.]
MTPAESTGCLPRVLVVGHDLPHVAQAGSILLYRLFQGWPQESVVALGPPRPQGVESLDCSFVPYEPPFERLERSRLFKWKRLLNSLGLMPAGQIRQCLPDGFMPQVIVHVLYSMGHAEAVYQYSRQSGVPLVLIVHDDPDEFNMGFGWAAPLARRRFGRIYAHASRRLCISPEMEQLLHVRYGVSGEVMYPNRSEHTVPRPLEDAEHLKQPGMLTLGYAGGLNYGYGQRLQEVVPILREAGVRLNIYGGALPESVGTDVVTNMGRINPPELLWERVKAECDAVLLPYCFPNFGHEKLYRSHFPSKLPEYLALGMPVLATGPADATGVKWGLQHPDACVVITAQDGEVWQKTLARLRDDAEWRRSLSASAVLRGNHDFDPLAIRARFQDTIRSAVSAQGEDRGQIPP